MGIKRIIYSSLVVAFISITTVLGANAEELTTPQENSMQSEVFVNSTYQQIGPSPQFITIANYSPNLEASSLSELKIVLANEMDKLSTDISVSYFGDLSNIMAEMRAIIDDYMYNNDYFRGVVYRIQYSSSGSELSIQLEYLTTPTQEAFIQSEVERIVRDIITPSMSDVEKVKAIHDYVVLNTTYSENSSTTPHSAYALFNEGKGVCQAYALATLRLLEEAGIEVRYVTGVAGGVLHAWNLVKVDGEWYHLDTTWNDPVFIGNVGDMSDYVRYDYFLISDKEISKDHQADEISDYPKATSERFVNLRSISEPAQVGNLLYFSNSNDDFKLYKINLLESAPHAQKVSNTRVQHLFYANDWLYFSNYSNGAYLYKVKIDGSEETLLVKSEVTNIKQVGNQLVAYSDNEVIYSEDIGGKVSPSVEKVNELVDGIQYLHPTFKQTAEQLIDLVNSLTDAERALLSQETLKTVNEIIENYEKMTTLTFSNSVNWPNSVEVNDPMKPWTITFSDEVLNTTENAKLIAVVDMFGNNIDINTKIVGNKVIVTPVNPYVANIPYTLIIKNNLQNINGTSLNPGVHLPFTFEP